MVLKTVGSLFGVGLLGAGLFVAVAPRLMTPSVAETRPAVKTPPLKLEGKEVAVMAAGCFWSMEAIFEKIKGVESVDSGYSNGVVAKPTYEQVCSGNTGHAEAVRIVFDPKVVSYKHLLEVLLTIRDPTTLNRQGPDAGTQYRSGVYYQDEAQKKTALAVVAEFEKRKVWSAPLVIKVEPAQSFYLAEEYHLDYFTKNPNNSYSKAAIVPKLRDLGQKFPELVK